MGDDLSSETPQRGRSAALLGASEASAGVLNTGGVRRACGRQGVSLRTDRHPSLPGELKRSSGGLVPLT